MGKVLAAAVGLSLALSTAAGAQSLDSLRAPAEPLVLKARGSFFVGGRSVEQTPAELQFGPVSDSVTVDQMYVDYMVPAGRAGLPVVMVHGATLTGKTYDTTPDGRMGWFEYFVRKGHPTYVVDQVGRARSGFNQAAINRRLGGEVPATPSAGVAPTVPGAPAATGFGGFRLGDRLAVWRNMRLGPQFGTPFPGGQFPVEAAGELAKQQVPDMTSQVPTPNPTWQRLAELAVGLKGAVLISHSQSGPYPMDAALIDPSGIRAIVALEPGGCRPTYTDAQIAALANIPTLVVFGDNLEFVTGLGTITWKDRMEGCRAYAARIAAAGGKVEVVNTADLGIRGNSHMIMQDRNNLQIADLVLKWIADLPARP